MEPVPPQVSGRQESTGARASSSGNNASGSGTIRLGNREVEEEASQSRLRVNHYWRQWLAQWEHGDHVAPNIALFSMLSGILLGSGFTMALVVTSQRAFGSYLFCLGIFHLMEYMTTAIFNPRRVKLDSFMYDPVTGYHLAIAASILEYFVKKSFYGWIYDYAAPIQCIGFVLAMIGQWLRSSAMIEASTSFNHHVASMKDHDHILITTGVFSIERHPSYLGFYMFTLGTQLLMFNPICFLAFAYVLHQFFSSRIRMEEAHLIRFFGDDYCQFRDRTPTYIPFIN